MNKHHNNVSLLGWALGLIALAFIPGIQIAFATPNPTTVFKTQLVETYGKIPLSFEPNQGQTDKQVQFLSRGSGYSLFLTSTEAVLSLHKRAGKDQKQSPLPSLERAGARGEGSDRYIAVSTALRMRLVGANPKPKVLGVDALLGKVNYFHGNDLKQWRTNILTYAKVKYEKIYPGIDLVYYGNQRQLEHGFVVAPGADPNAIQLTFVGEETLAIGAQGDLVTTTVAGEVRLHKPRVYQNINGQQHEIDGCYLLHRGKDKARAQVGFRVAAYDKGRPLIIDPVLTYSTFLGGSDFDIAHGIAVDSLGNAYMTGETLSTDFPTTPGAFDTSRNGSASSPRDVFVTKINAAGNGLVFSTYLGGDRNDTGYSIAVDAVGDTYVTGQTESGNFPTTPGAFDQSFNSVSGGPDAFVAKLSASGSLVYSTYLGGSGNDAGLSITVDISRNAYVTGYTLGPFLGPGFPTTPGAFGQSFNGNVDAFVTKFNADGSALVYSSHLGGDGRDVGNGIAVDSDGNAYVTGETGIASLTKFPTTPGAYQTSFNGGNSDVFITKVNAAGSGLVYSTFVGGDGNDIGNSIALDPVGNAYVTGSVFFNPTDVHNFPTTPGAFKVSVSDQANGFVTKLNADGSALIYSTYLGGSDADCTGIFLSTGCHIAVDSLGNAYVTGATMSNDFPTTSGSFNNSFNAGGGDAFITVLNVIGTELVYSTFLGSGGGDSGNGIALDASGGVYVTGFTDNGFSPPHFPTTPGAFDTSYNGVGDAFVAKISDTALPPSCVATPPFQWPTLGANGLMGQDYVEFNRGRQNHYHTGIDIRARCENGKTSCDNTLKINENVFAVARGEVEAVCPNGVKNGNTKDGCFFGDKQFSTKPNNHKLQGVVILKHFLSTGQTLFSLYAHLESVEMFNPHECIDQGTKLGVTQVPHRPKINIFILKSRPSQCSIIQLKIPTRVSIPQVVCPQPSVGGMF